MWYELKIVLFVLNKECVFAYSLVTEVQSQKLDQHQFLFSFNLHLKSKKCGMFCDLIRNGVEGHENQYKYVNPLQVQWYNMLIMCY